MTKWYPNLSGKIPGEVEKAIKTLYDRVYSIGDRTTKVEEAVAPVVVPGKPATWIHPEDYKNISQNLQANGVAPLDVTGLIGILSTPQIAAANTSTSPGTPSIPGGVPGQFQIMNGQLFFYDTSTNPPTWRTITAIAVYLTDLFANLTNYDPGLYAIGSKFLATDKGVEYIVLTVAGNNAWVYAGGVDTVSGIAGKPTLGANDAGYLLYDPLWDHTWKWNGSAWHYADDEPWYPGDVKLVASSSAPLKNGWHVADGSVGITISQDNATTTTITLPNLLSYYLQGVAAGSYTGSGAAAHAPTITAPGSTGASSTGDSLTVGTANISTAAGATTVVTSVSLNDPTHSHSIGSVTAGTDGTPATIGLVPYYRL